MKKKTSAIYTFIIYTVLYAFIIAFLMHFFKDQGKSLVYNGDGWRQHIRAMEYYDAHHEETVAFTAKQISMDEKHVRAYLDNPRFNLNTDPMKKSVLRAWNYMDNLGLLDESAKQINIEDHINTELYKAALDECTEKYGSEDQKFYEKMQALYARNNY